MKRMEVCYTYTYEDSIIKTTKHWKREEDGKGEWECNGGGELSQDTLYTCMVWS
jgi:hypothetical protein